LQHEKNKTASPLQ